VEAALRRSMRGGTGPCGSPRARTRAGQRCGDHPGDEHSASLPALSRRHTKTCTLRASVMILRTGRCFAFATDNLSDKRDRRPSVTDILSPMATARPRPCGGDHGMGQAKMGGQSAGMARKTRAPAEWGKVRRSSTRCAAPCAMLRLPRRAGVAHDQEPPPLQEAATRRWTPQLSHDTQRNPSSGSPQATAAYCSSLKCPGHGSSPSRLIRRGRLEPSGRGNISGRPRFVGAVRGLG
jgi:hypothetical protein